MSKKRTSEESNDDEQTNDDGQVEVFKPGNNAKRAKLASMSDTTLYDLPMELLECILVKVVAMEVNDMKMAECEWEENTDLTIDRLDDVCSQWSGIFDINCFRCKVLRALELSQKTIRMEILHQFLIEKIVFGVTTLKDEIFVLCWTRDTLANVDDAQSTRYIVVYDRSNMGEEKDVIRQSGMRPFSMAACNVSNCVYVLSIMENTEGGCIAVQRITKDADHDQFSISTWISDLRPSLSFISTSATGNLLILSESCGRNPALVSIYDANGSLKHNITLPTLVTCIYDCRLGANVLEKSNGNLILVSHNDLGKTRLTEMATNGCILRQYQSTLGSSSAVNFADSYGRIVISDPIKGIELLDSEFNVLMTATGPLLEGTQFGSPYIVHYDSEKNEVVGVYIQSQHASAVAVIRLTEE